MSAYNLMRLEVDIFFYNPVEVGFSAINWRQMTASLISPLTEGN